MDFAAAEASMTVAVHTGDSLPVNRISVFHIMSADVMIKPAQTQ